MTAKACLSGSDAGRHVRIAVADLGNVHVVEDALGQPVVPRRERACIDGFDGVYF